jgi:DNA mismatch repair ATPase MutS
MADGTRLHTIETQLTQLTETINTHIQTQLTQITKTVANHSHSITDTSTVLQRLETMLQSLATNAVTHGQTPRPNNQMQTRNVNLEFPCFNGLHALEWLFKAK